MDLDNDIRTDFSKHWLSYVLCFIGLATFSEYSSVMVASGLKPISLECPKVNRKKGSYLFPVIEAIFRLALVGLSIALLLLKLRKCVLY